MEGLKAHLLISSRKMYVGRTLRAGRVVLADFLVGLVIDVQVHVGVLRAVRRGLELLPAVKDRR
jgi:hypothetical protein